MKRRAPERESVCCNFIIHGREQRNEVKDEQAEAKDEQSSGESTEQTVSAEAGGEFCSACRHCGGAGSITCEQCGGSGDYTRINPAMDEHGEINLLLFDGLTAHDGENRVVPALAKSWEYEEDTYTYTFFLEEGVTQGSG